MNETFEYNGTAYPVHPYPPGADGFCCYGEHIGNQIPAQYLVMSIAQIWPDNQKVVYWVPACEPCADEFAVHPANRVRPI